MLCHGSSQAAVKVDFKCSGKTSLLGIYWAVVIYKKDLHPSHAEYLMYALFKNCTLASIPTEPLYYMVKAEVY